MTTLVEPQVLAEPIRRRFSVAEYYAMADAGILTHDERVELIDGEVITTSPPENEHAASVDRANDFLVPLVTGRAIVRVRGHVRLDDYHQPEPDLTLLKRRDDFYRYQAPGPDDVLLLIEVSHASLSYDRRVKLAMYARFEIPEVWIANIPARVVEAYTDPVDGEYMTSRVYHPGEMVSPMSFEDVNLPVGQFIGALSEAEGGGVDEG